MDRETSLQRLLARGRPWDLAVIGGGASGVAVALDAASRGYAVCLLEQSDFGKGTSSRSTKLAHGGVRYLRQGHLGLVMEGLRERGLLRRNAPHLVHGRAFVVPSYAWWEGLYYGTGLKLYDLLAGRLGFGKSQRLSRDEALARLPTLAPENGGADLRGGVLYHDGQFDDARLLVHLAQSAEEHNGVLLNHARVVALGHDPAGRLDGLTFEDAETGRRHDVAARCVVNAAGPFADAVRRIDDPAPEPMIAPSQGSHVVLGRQFLPGDAALMVPRTPDGRVLFAIPWHDRVMVGTTDVPVSLVSVEPVPMEREIDFLLKTAGRYLRQPPTRADVLSTFAGIRPLVKPGHDRRPRRTASLSRDHVIRTDPSGLITLAGGKWTTARRMAEDCVNRAADRAGLPHRPCVTRELRIHGWHEDAARFGPLAAYGSDAPALEMMMDLEPDLGRPLHRALSIRMAQVAWAVRNEMARTVDDVLSRRTRATFLDARAAIETAPEVARVMAVELRKDEAWTREQVTAFTSIAKGYLPRETGEPAR